MVKRHAVFEDLEALLEQIERLSSDVLRGLHEAHQNLEVGISPELTQNFLLRGQLIFEAYEWVQNNSTQLNTDEREALTKKMAQLVQLESGLGNALESVQGALRQSLKQTVVAQNQLRLYEVKSTKQDAYLEEA
jgi:hypothetical protein